MLAVSFLLPLFVPFRLPLLLLSQSFCLLVPYLRSAVPFLLLSSFRCRICLPCGLRPRNAVATRTCTRLVEDLPPLRRCTRRYPFRSGVCLSTTPPAVRPSGKM